MKEAGQKCEASLDAVDKAISRFESYTKYKDFKHFHIQQAISFKKHMAKETNARDSKPLSASTLHSTFRHLKAFFQWLSREQGYKSKISYSDAEYFNLSEKETRTATAKRTKRIPTLEQIKQVFSLMPDRSLMDKRDRALFAFIVLTGARDKAIISLKIKHVDIDRNCIIQDSREVDTKFSKTFDTYFFPVDTTFLDCAQDWYNFLRKELLWAENDPLFPATEFYIGQPEASTPKLTRKHWKTTEPVRRIFKKAFLNAGLPYANPHSFRDTLVRFGERVCSTPAEFKAWSQNLGHESVLTTFTSYGNIPSHEQADILSGLTASKDQNDPLSTMEAALEQMRKNQRKTG